MTPPAPPPAADRDERFRLYVRVDRPKPAPTVKRRIYRLPKG